MKPRKTLDSSIRERNGSDRTLMANGINKAAVLLFQLIVYTNLKYISLLLIAVIAASIYWNHLLFALLKQAFPLLFSIAIFSLTARELWSNRSKFNFVVKIYFKSGILTYLRAFMIAVVTVSLGILVYLYVPEFLRWGWGNLVFGNSANVMFQPLDTAYQFGQQVSELQGNSFDYRWLFLVPVWMLFILALPFWAEVEEKVFRQGIHSWKEITMSSIKFGLIHLIMGIPICWALTLSIPGFLFACRYKYAYHRYLRKFPDEAKAQAAGVLASTGDHAIYNAILITFAVAILLLIN